MFSQSSIVSFCGKVFRAVCCVLSAKRLELDFQLIVDTFSFKHNALCFWHIHAFDLLMDYVRTPLVGVPYLSKRSTIGEVHKGSPYESLGQKFLIFDLKRVFVWVFP